MFEDTSRREAMLMEADNLLLGKLDKLTDPGRLDIQGWPAGA